MTGSPRLEEGIMQRSAKVVMLAALAFAIVTSAIAIVPAQGDTETFTLFGDTIGGWGLTSTSITSPGPHLTVTVGDTVALTLNSADSIRHNWFIDYNNNSVVDSGEPSSADFQGTTAGSFTFTADRVGTFWYKCKYHTTMMIGQITIQTAPTFELYGSATLGWGETNTTGGITSPGPTLTVNQGDTVTIDLTSADGTSHTLVIDYNNNSVANSGEPVSLPFSGSTSVRFTFVADRAGAFQYFCGSHGATVMKGTLIVRGTGTPPSGGDNTVLIIGGVIIVVAIVAVAAAMMMRRKPKA